VHLAEAKPTHFDISLEVCYTLKNNLLHILFEGFLFGLISLTCVSHTRVLKMHVIHSHRKQVYKTFKIFMLTYI